MWHSLPSQHRRAWYGKQRMICFVVCGVVCCMCCAMGPLQKTARAFVSSSASTARSGGLGNNSPRLCVDFARDASYSSHPTYSRPDEDGSGAFPIVISRPSFDCYSTRNFHRIQRIFLCRVLVGKSCLGSDGLIQPAVRIKSSHTLFDTTTNANDLDRQILWVTYHDGTESDTGC